MSQPELESTLLDAISPPPWSGGRPLPVGVWLCIQLVAAVFPVALVIWLVEIPKVELWSTVLIAGSSALLATSWGYLLKRRLWVKPAVALLAAAEAARDGEAPIEELSRFEGRVAPLARVIQDLLRLTKEQKAELAQLELEMRGRIANRTDALERKIGSLRMQAMRDVLTGLYNRRSFEQELPRFLAEHQAAGRDACLLMIDVDCFKTLNDTLGHASGDQLLKEIGQIIRSTIRESDFAFRCGGDEFVILLHDMGPGPGQEVSRRLESLVEKLTEPMHLPCPPRLSIGSCCLSEMEVPSVDDWTELADKRLYAVKGARDTRHSGRVAAAAIKPA
jgi:diguanylate cyclase (GGDEF)-like protein